ncbi:class I SAM-dependent methyltransferase [Yasminevirus sp. GU-2018]|uniref:Class I SAM-dependent methyltransferase n=1 Tax=Yasminevirus sp. GU-2018 TaxID=2420051 RepID=A0A5K0U8J3_9VIRU|nr:class I SAM-dependent methyltransferase [Yasminevirus sp. GU-2018]
MEPPIEKQPVNITEKRHDINQGLNHTGNHTGNHAGKTDDQTNVQSGDPQGEDRSSAKLGAVALTDNYQLNSWVSWGKQQLGGLKSGVYNATIGHFYTIEVMRNLLVEIPDNSVILDVGVGTGYTYSKNSDLIKRKNLTVVGVDIDPEYIRSAKHAVIDSYLENHVRLVLADIYKAPESELPSRTFDFVFFSDSYAVIPEVHKMITFCEKFLKPTGQMVVTSTLFDKFDSNIDWIKQRIVYVSSVEFGKMMLKSDLEAYIKTRYSGNVRECFRLIDNKWIPASDCRMKTYIVKWKPDPQLASQTSDANIHQGESPSDGS